MKAVRRPFPIVFFIHSAHSNQILDKNEQNGQNANRIKLGGGQMIFQEGETVELKAIVAEDIKKEIVAFANCEGGKLYIGVQDDRTVLGLENSDKTSLQISNMVRNAIKLDLTMFLHYENIGNGNTGWCLYKLGVAAFGSVRAYN